MDQEDLHSSSSASTPSNSPPVRRYKQILSAVGVITTRLCETVQQVERLEAARNCSCFLDKSSYPLPEQPDEAIYPEWPAQDAMNPQNVDDVMKAMENVSITNVCPDVIDTNCRRMTPEDRQAAEALRCKQTRLARKTFASPPSDQSASKKRKM